MEETEKKCHFRVWVLYTATRHCAIFIILECYYTTKAAVTMIGIYQQVCFAVEKLQNGITIAVKV